MLTTDKRVKHILIFRTKIVKIFEFFVNFVKITCFQRFTSDFLHDSPSDSTVSIIMLLIASPQRYETQGFAPITCERCDPGGRDEPQWLGWLRVEADVLL